MLRIVVSRAMRHKAVVHITPQSHATRLSSPDEMLYRSGNFFFFLIWMPTSQIRYGISCSLGERLVCPGVSKGV
jgi:hypothetical protein